MITMKMENGNKVWRNEVGQLHREDGPAVEYANGTKEWWMYGIEQVKKIIPMFLTNII
jgi:hypothetical protein